MSRYIDHFYYNYLNNFSFVVTPLPHPSHAIVKPRQYIPSRDYQRKLYGLWRPILEPTAAPCQLFTCPTLTSSYFVLAVPRLCHLLPLPTESSSPSCPPYILFAISLTLKPSNLFNRVYLILAALFALYERKIILITGSGHGFIYAFNILIKIAPYGTWDLYSREQ